MTKEMMKNIVSKLCVIVMALILAVGNVGVSFADETSEQIATAADASATATEAAAEEYDGFKLAIPTIPYLDPALSKFTDVSPIEISMGFSLASAYIWRGQNLGTDASWQPWITVSPDFEPLGNLSFTYWNDITKDELNADGSKQTHRETDFSLDYTFSVADLANKTAGVEELTGAGKMLDFNLSSGYIYYDFVYDGGGKSQEFYTGLTYNLPLNPSFFIYHDWDRGNGSWLEWKLSHGFDLKVFTLNTYAKLGYNHEQWGKSSKLSTLDFGASVPIPIGDHMTLEPFLSFTKRLGSTYSDAGTDLTHDEFYGGMNYTISF